jgi:O-antigen ligase
MPGSATSSVLSTTDRSAIVALTATGVLLALCLVTGGSSQESGAGVLTAQAFSLPLIGWAGWRLLHRHIGPVQIAWLAFAGALAAIPFLQAIVPASIAEDAGGREALGADLVLFGIGAPPLWSLAPIASAEAALALLPALAIFWMSFTLTSAARRHLALLIMLLAMASLLLGVAQLGAPQESSLNPYPQWKPAMSGFFANPNHQASLLVVAATLACARLVTALGAWTSGRPRHVLRAVFATLVILLAAAALPLTGSRAGVALMILSIALVTATHGPAWRGGKRTRIMLAGSLALAVIGLLLAIRWMQVDAIDELRAPLRAATTEIAARFLPLGAGLGSYMPLFEQEAERSWLLDQYVNHAHNEYTQWWLEAGVPALFAGALGILAITLTFRDLWRSPAGTGSLGVTCLLALGAVLAHSLVDYPLRTPAMLAVAAALAGIAAAQASDSVRTNPAARASRGGDRAPLTLHKDQIR